jgi:hypothetical protein
VVVVPEEDFTEGVVLQVEKDVVAGRHMPDVEQWVEEDAEVDEEAIITSTTTIPQKE